MCEKDVKCGKDGKGHGFGKRLGLCRTDENKGTDTETHGAKGAGHCFGAGFGGRCSTTSEPCDERSALLEELNRIDMSRIHIEERLAALKPTDQTN